MVIPDCVSAFELDIKIVKRTKMGFQPVVVFWGLLVLLMFKHHESQVVPVLKHERIIDYDQLRNAVFLGSGEIILAGDRMLHKLGADLYLKQEASLCDRNSCENINIIFLVTKNNDTLIVCGTNNDGLCEKWYVVNFANISTNSVLKVSTQSRFPSVAIIANNKKMVLGYTTTTENVQQITYMITDVNLEDFSVKNLVALGSELSNASKPFIYYQGALPNKLFDNKYYFFIHENDNGMYKSKLVIVCNSIKIARHISCTKDNMNLTLIRNADILDTPNGMVFVGAFVVSSTNPQFVDGDSVICIEELTTLDPQSTTMTCSDTTYGSLTLTSSYQLPSSEGYVTSIKGRKEPTSDILIINIGTSRGRFIQLFSAWTNLDSVRQPLQQFAYRVVQEGAPVVAIQSQKDGTETYVVTGQRIALYSSANCDDYKTCTATVSGKNPLCGWCFIEGRSTTKSECSSGWKFMLDPCGTILVSPEGQRIGDNQQLQISVKDNPLYDIRTGDTFKCRLLGNKIDSLASYDSSTRNFTCISPASTDHKTSILELIGTRSGREFLLGASEYLVYTCDQFKRCTQCMDKRVQCQWCSGSCRKSCDTTQTQSCPIVIDREQYVPNGVEFNVTFDVTIPIPPTYAISCYVKTEVKPFTGTTNGTHVTCRLKISMTDKIASKQDVGVVVKYGPTSADAELNQETNITVYRCDRLAHDCTHCKALNSSRYHCKWDNSTKTCVTGPRTNVQCPKARITKVSPLDAPVGGQTRITINGTDYTKEILSVTVANVPCSSLNFTTCVSPDFQGEVFESIICNSGSTVAESSGPVNLTNHITFAGPFDYKTPGIIENSPKAGPISGGTVITFSGRNLAIGNKEVKLRYNNAVAFDRCHIIDTSTITCVQPAIKSDMTSLRIFFDGSAYTFYNPIVNFTLRDDPVVQNVSLERTILSGGTLFNVSGVDLTNAQNHKVVASYNGNSTSIDCDHATSSFLQCRFPPAPPNLVTDLFIKLNQNQSEQVMSDAICKCFKSIIIIKLDGYEKAIPISYYPDPEFKRFNGVKTMNNSEKYITLTGSYLDLVAPPEEFIVIIGEAQCTELEITSTSLRCKIPDNHDDGSQYSVIVKVGSIYRQDIGYLKYYVSNVSTIVRLIGAVLGVLVGILVLVGSVIYGKYYMMRRKCRLLEQKLQVIEMEISSIARQEIAELENGMSFVTRTLVDQGLPFHGYQQYAFNVMFSADQVLIDQPGQVEHSLRKGLDSLEKLILNKMFLVSLVSTMEKEKRFFVRERVNLSGNLCVILMGKMGYLNEVLQDLLMCLVQESLANKTHKSLFGRFETITENLLSNWLALTIYPHLKANSGSPLYLLFMAMQLTIENGPIDAITGDAKKTLSEEKLLRRWQSTRQEDYDVQCNSTQLTLNVSLDNGDHVYQCKVLECDAINQVKSKCLSQIYVNYPVSKLGVDPTELRLDWQLGPTKAITLRDIDNSSIKEGHLLRLNTLAHYNVRDNANMTLIDSTTLDQGPHRNINHEYPDQANDRSKLIHEADADLENPEDTTKWHLVKPGEVEALQRKKFAIDRLYLNTLFKTKQSINEHLITLFDHILDSNNCPPPAKFICDFMDILANKFKIDENTLFAWKSQSHAARLWSRMIRQPNQLFDVHVPQYVEGSLSVIAQVLEDSLAPSAPKLSKFKDCPGQKQVFYSMVQRYREKAKEFQKGLQAKGEQANVLTEFLADLNKMQQQQQSFNKMAYLQKFYDQLLPYIDKIVDDLSANAETKNLELGKKMREVMDMMK